MHLPKNLFDHSFQEKNLTFLFASLLAILVYIGTLGLGAELSLDRLAGGWEDKLNTRYTIEIPYTDGEEQKKTTEKIITAVNSMNEIESVAIVSDQEVARLLNSWIADETFLQTLPLPKLIDLQIKQGKAINQEELKDKIYTLSKEARVESHADWLDRLLRLVGGFTFLSKIAILLSLISLMLVMSLISHAMVTFHQSTLGLLKLLGTTNKKLASHFVRHIWLISWPAASVGAGAAGLTMMVISFLFEGVWGLPTLSSLTWDNLILCVIIAPLVALSVTMVASHFIVLNLLKRMP